MKELSISGEEEMIRAGVLFSQSLNSGGVVAVTGELGAGKTHFAKGIVLGLGCNDEVTSPTFSLVNEYRGGSGPVFHFDFYRIEILAELEGIGWEEYLDSVEHHNGVIIVEWADKFPEVLPQNSVWCRIQILAEGRRLLSCFQEMGGGGLAPL